MDPLKKDLIPITEKDIAMENHLIAGHRSTQRTRWILYEYRDSVYMVAFIPWDPRLVLVRLRERISLAMFLPNFSKMPFKNLVKSSRKCFPLVRTLFHQRRAAARGEPCQRRKRGWVIDLVGAVHTNKRVIWEIGLCFFLRVIGNSRQRTNSVQESLIALPYNIYLYTNLSQLL